MQYAPTMGIFKSAPGAPGIIHLMIGYIPDHFQLFAGIDGTNPNLYVWFNKRMFPANSADGVNPPGAASYDRTLIGTGSSGVRTVDISNPPLITPNDGGFTISATEVATSGVTGHVDRAGNLVTVLPNGTFTTPPGLTLAASIQTAGKLNQWIAFQSDWHK